MGKAVWSTDGFLAEMEPQMAVVEVVGVLFGIYVLYSLFCYLNRFKNVETKVRCLRRISDGMRSA